MHTASVPISNMVSEHGSGPGLRLRAWFRSWARIEGRYVGIAIVGERAWFRSWTRYGGNAIVDERAWFRSSARIEGQYVGIAILPCR